VGINTAYPIWCDKNNIKEFALGSLNLKRFLLSICKVGGVVAIYPSAVPFTVFDAYESQGDFRILDLDLEVAWDNTVHSHWPTYGDSPVILQVEQDSGYFNPEFVAGELFNVEKKVLRKEATFDLTKVAADLLAVFSEKGVLIAPTVFTNGSCAQKIKHVDYTVDMGLLRKMMQVPTATMQRIDDLNFRKQPKNRRFVNSIYYGGRYSLCGKELRRVMKELDDRWFREVYGSRKGY